MEAVLSPCAWVEEDAGPALPPPMSAPPTHHLPPPMKLPIVLLSPCPLPHAPPPPLQLDCVTTQLRAMRDPKNASMRNRAALAARTKRRPHAHNKQLR
jgi:hypothetical protein